MDELTGAIGQCALALCSSRSIRMPRPAPDHSNARRAVEDAMRALDAGRVAEAVKLFPKAIALNPENALLHCNYSAALFATGRYDRAEAAAIQATRLDRADANAWNNLGISQQAQGRLSDAISAYQQAVSCNSSHRDARINLALAAEEVGDIRSAGRLLADLVVQAADDPTAHFELGRILLEGRHPQEALPYLQRASSLAPLDSGYLNALGVALKQLGRPEEAANSYRAAIKSSKDFALAHINLACVCNELGHLDEAVQAGREAVRLAPESIEAINNLASALRSQGDVESAATLFARAAEMSNDPRPGSNLLCVEQYRATTTRPRLLQLHSEWAARFATMARQPVFGCANDEARRLRIGFSSPDLGQHPVGFFLTGVLANLDSEQFETVCYSDRRERDALTAKLQRHASQWRDTPNLTDAQLLSLIRNDGVDILIDLAGHTRKNRLQVFARRAAPIQATWLGYVGTTGVPAMDYLIADRFHVRESEDDGYTESVMRLPNGYLCYSPPSAPEVSDLPALRNGFVTFGAFHNPAKISRPTIERWARLLRETDGSRLLFKYRGYTSQGVVDSIRSRFAACGIGSSRLEFRGATDLSQHLQAFHDIDLQLDPLPYSGGLTTCESLWMGVPVVTMPGETFAGRHATSHMHNAGLAEFVAESEEQYESIVKKWTQDPTGLADLRRSLRDRVDASPLCDSKEFSKGIGESFRAMWLAYLGRKAKPTEPLSGPHLGKLTKRSRDLPTRL